MLQELELKFLKINQSEISNLKAKNKQISDCQKQTLMLRPVTK